ncbi:hypothetical protein [Actinomadura sp. WMMA1423]|uniref:hypothetical protein n=1 Tax=Actinomadura sp. WMMA1423 TaxID=2591108 RepID=UPI0011474871|nr:hypothetical protein [Actinomadura sp. WMMA1423]
MLAIVTVLTVTSSLAVVPADAATLLRAPGARGRSPVGSRPLAAERIKTRLSMNVPDRLVVGDRVPVTGRLEQQDRDGTWAPLARKQLDLQFNRSTSPDWNTIAAPVTDADGYYSVQVPIVENGAWAIDFADDPVNLPDDYYGYEMSYAGTNVRQVTHRTSISGFNAAPEPAGLGGTIRASGTVMFTMADGTKKPSGGATVRLQFSTDGKTWKDRAAQSPGGDGRFAIDVKAERDGYWRTRVPDDDGYLVVPSVSGADYVDVRYRTHIHQFNASPEPVKKGAAITVKGLLYRYMPAGRPGPGAPVSIYFKAKGSSNWTGVAVVKTASNGWFGKRFKASKDGYWTAVYKGSSAYLRSNQPADYVDVR